MRRIVEMSLDGERPNYGNMLAHHMAEWLSSGRSDRAKRWMDDWFRETYIDIPEMKFMGLIEPWCRAMLGPDGSCRHCGGHPPEGVYCLACDAFTDHQEDVGGPVARHEDARYDPVASKSRTAVRSWQGSAAVALEPCLSSVSPLPG